MAGKLEQEMAQSTEATAAAAQTDIVGRLDALYEFDREPVTPERFEPGVHFAALFAGEHVAGPSSSSARCS